MAKLNNDGSANTNHGRLLRLLTISPKIAFLLVSLSLGQLGDGLNIFQGIYLVGVGWNEGSVGVALSLMGLTSLIIQPWAGDWVDKTTVDRRIFLAVAALMTALSASSILLVHSHSTDYNYGDHVLIYGTKIVEGITSSFLGPCLAALTLASFGPHHFDAVMASNIFWGHVGSVAAAVLAGLVSFVMFPQIKLCFLVVGASALVACFFVQYLPQGDPMMGRGFAGKVAMDEHGTIENVESNETATDDTSETTSMVKMAADVVEDVLPEAASYYEVLADKKTIILCCTGFFFHFANANVLLVLGELMGNHDEGSGQSRSAIPLVAGAIVTAQVTMAIATYAGDKLTLSGVGRKPLFLAALVSLPIRCALILYLQDSGDTALLSTQVLDGIGGGLMGLVQPYLVADITFGTGRFNVLMGMIASFFGLGATLSNFLGQMVVEKYGHETSLIASLCISVLPVCIFLFMPETMGMRTKRQAAAALRRSSTGVESPDNSLYGSFD